MKLLFLLAALLFSALASAQDYCANSNFTFCDNDRRADTAIGTLGLNYVILAPTGTTSQAQILGNRYVCVGMWACYAVQHSDTPLLHFGAAFGWTAAAGTGRDPAPALIISPSNPHSGHYFDYLSPHIVVSRNPAAILIGTFARTGTSGVFTVIRNVNLGAPLLIGRDYILNIEVRDNNLTYTFTGTDFAGVPWTVTGQVDMGTTWPAPGNYIGYEIYNARNANPPTNVYFKAQWFSK